MGRVLYVLTVLATLFSACHAEKGNATLNYVEIVESQVLLIARNSEDNFNRSCELVASCKGNCSRQSCLPVQDDEEGYKCVSVANNTNCYNEDGNLGCQIIRVSFAKSFIRIPTGSDDLTAEANTTICSQRNLDTIFKNISSTHNRLNLTSWAYFASVEGVQRSFPGLDVPLEKCNFEPRKRPWFMGVTAVEKDVIVLLDVGNSMGDKLPGDLLVPLNQTYGDRVTVITFNKSGASAVLSPGDSNLTSGFVKANQTFENTPVLRVILTITDGQIMPVNSTETFVSIRSINSLVQIYNFGRNSPVETQLKELSCYCNGTYEQITNAVKNPLWTLRSYFGIVARLWLTALNDRPYWTKPYNDSGSLGNVITVVYPAFADNYTLIGVAGIDVLLNELKSIDTSELTSVLLPHALTEPLVKGQPQLPCNFALKANQCNEPGALSDALCLNTDKSGLSFEQRFCNCSGVCSPKVINRKSSLSPALIAGIGVGVGIIVMVAFALFLLLAWRSPSANSKGWESQSVKEYTQKQLAAAMNNWRSYNVIGVGAHGVIFKGKLPDGTPVAIKKPKKDLKQVELDTFSTELEFLSKLNHTHLVRLLGYCKQETILIYDYMENGSLYDLLLKDSTRTKLNWEMKLKIGLGASMGLQYLHEGAAQKTFHGDIKTANILLKRELQAHISDFRLSLWIKNDKDSFLLASQAYGTIGYVDPNFTSSGQVTRASDVYSFGIVLMQLISGKGVVVENRNIKDWARCFEEKEALDKVLDKTLETPEYGVGVLVDVMKLALTCT
uniref:Protein kinase domain-containing protein n=1 Tax=Physcomitrium patens TaxID=3218 RepID=A0A7I4BV55_PHYPA